MSQLTLPRLARKRRDLSDQAAIPVATAHTVSASHLTGDRRREPTFDDLIAGNKREPSHADLLADDEDEDGQELKPAARMLPIVYPGVSVEALAWLRAQDEQPATPAAIEEPPAPPAPNHDGHRLIPAGQLVAVPLPTAPTEAVGEEPPTVSVADQRLLFDALDALDRLPGLYTVDAKSFETEASIAAIQTYAALRPDLLHEPPVLMQVAPLAAYLKLVDVELQQAEPIDHAARLAESWTDVDTAHARLAVDDFVPDQRFYSAIKLDALGGMVDELIDDLCDVLAVLDAEAEDIELLAIEAGLPMSGGDEQDGAEMDEAVESTGHLPGYYDAGPEPEPAAASLADVAQGLRAFEAYRADNAESEA